MHLHGMVSASAHALATSLHPSRRWNHWLACATRAHRRGCRPHEDAAHTDTPILAGYSAHGCWISSGDQEIFGSPEEIYDSSLSWAFFGVVDRRAAEVLGHQAGNVFTEMCRNVCKEYDKLRNLFGKETFGERFSTSRVSFSLSRYRILTDGYTD